MGVPGNLDLVADRASTRSAEPADSSTTTTSARSRSAVIAGWVRETVITLAALGGLLCVVAVLASWMFGVSLVLFRTGSMTPAIPAGSVAVVREVPATSVDVGDVVTVEHPRSTMPITHRVVAIEPDPTNPEAVVLTMKGDANDSVDPFTYHVEEVRTVIWSVPHAGGVIGWMRSPLALGAVTIAVAALVTWSFWPREPGARSDGDHALDDGESQRAAVTSARGDRAR